MIRTASTVLALSASAAAAGAQATPFLFAATPSAGTGKGAAFGYYELGYGERTFEPVAGDRIEQAVGVRAMFGSSISILAQSVARFVLPPGWVTRTSTVEPT
jgi:hypothetical protein